MNAAGSNNDIKRREHILLNTSLFSSDKCKRRLKLNIYDVVAATKARDPISNTVEKPR